MVLEKTLESPLNCKEIKPVNPKGNQSWVFTGRTDAEAETPILQPPDAKSWLIGKDPDARKDWRQEEKGMTQDEMFGWHHRLNGHEFERAPGVGDGQGTLACCSPWGRKELDISERLNWELNWNMCKSVLYFGEKKVLKEGEFKATGCTGIGNQTLTHENQKHMDVCGKSWSYWPHRALSMSRTVDYTILGTHKSAEFTKSPMWPPQTSKGNGLTSFLSW